MRRLTLILTIVLAVFGSSCANISALLHTSRVYHGNFDFHRFGIEFIPDGTDDEWCLTGDIDGLPGRPTWPQFSGQNVMRHIVVRGQLSLPGHYGHLRACTRELRVTEVI